MVRGEPLREESAEAATGRWVRGDGRGVLWHACLFSGGDVRRLLLSDSLLERYNAMIVAQFLVCNAI